MAVDLEALRRLAQAATPGSWHEDGPWWWGVSGLNPECSSMVTAGDDRRPVVIVHLEGNEADAAFIAAANPAAVLDLITAIEALTTEVIEARQSANNWALKATGIVAWIKNNCTPPQAAEARAEMARWGRNGGL